MQSRVPLWGAWLESPNFGVLAQFGLEHLLDRQGVTGSSPVHPTAIQKFTSTSVSADGDYRGCPHLGMVFLFTVPQYLAGIPNIF